MPERESGGPEPDHGRRNRAMILGIVGGVGSGKSTVAGMLAAEGAAVISADEIAHEVIQLPEIRDQVRAWWGSDVFRPDGNVDRKAVADRVFGDPEALERLSGLIHPEVIRRITAAADEFRRSHPGEVLVLDVPLLAETPLKNICDQIVFVASPSDLRRERTIQRGWTAQELEKRESHQAPLEEKRRLADHDIDNSGALEATREQVRELYHRLRSRREEDAP